LKFAPVETMFAEREFVPAEAMVWETLRGPTTAFEFSATRVTPSAVPDSNPHTARAQLPSEHAA
jgi:hypothetical protein